MGTEAAFFILVAPVYYFYCAVIFPNYLDPQGSKIDFTMQIPGVNHGCEME